MTESAAPAASPRAVGRVLAALLVLAAVVAAGYSSAEIGVAGGSVAPRSVSAQAVDPAAPDGPATLVGRAYGLDADTPLVPTEPADHRGVAIDEPPLPIGVEIERLGITSQLVLLGLTDAGELQVPAGRYYDYAGWFRHGTVPGEPGPAVIAGHLDSDRAPSVFHRLREVVPGDVVVIERADGSTVRFVVDQVAQYAKEDFPTNAVYGPTGDPQLRLITCGGAFDPDAGGYGDNLIVFASQA